MACESNIWVNILVDAVVNKWSNGYPAFFRGGSRIHLFTMLEAASVCSLALTEFDGLILTRSCKE